MREFLKRAKADYLLSSVLCIALGIIFVVWKRLTGTPDRDKM